MTDDQRSRLFGTAVVLAMFALILGAMFGDFAFWPFATPSFAATFWSAVAPGPKRR